MGSPFLGEDMSNLTEHGDGTVSVEVELGFTKSMGKGTYEFLRVDIRQGLRGKPGTDLDQLEVYAEEITTRLYEKIEGQIVAKVRELDAQLGPKRSRDSSIHAKD